ncbi:hypothetical protein SLS55_001311 [Diplodia seriata]|uniref:NACHT domain-containing protein n=1 Tax=Diplodia seriata TaxID=420778 RepID=A0ABR3CWR5_9PEZI
MAATGVLDSTPGYTHPADAEPSLSDRLDDRGELPPDPRQRWDMVPHGKPYVAGETQPISTERYTVGWIAALPLERAAAEQILDSIHPKPTDFSKTPNDHNTYTFGQIGEHYIVITSLEVGIYGTNSAATTAQWMLSSFPQIRFGLLVGIGAGLPSEDADIRLGDVAVSQPDGATGGVVQYDLVKATSDGPRRKGSLNKPPAVLLSALGKLQAKHKSKEYGIPTILEEWKQRNPAMFESEPGDPGYEFQGVENDRLFDEQYQHQKGKNCKKCDPSKILSRDPPVRKDAERPRIHYGVIASGNALVKDAGWRSKLLEHIDEECICYEMEAAGLMNNFPCLVIRGICDYADSHKNDQWQPYAAGTAAAFAKELLQLVEVDGLVSTPRAKDLMDKLNEVSHSLENVESVTTSIRVDLDDKELRKWLSPSDPWTSYEQNIKERHGESGSWFIGGQPFSKWKREPQSFLWLHGSPGCGKTVLSSAIIKDLTTPKNTAPTKTLFFFFDFRNAKSTTEQMLRSLTFQYSQGNNLYQAYLHQQRSTEQAGGKRDSWETMLQTAVSQAQGDLNIVLDALDECKDRKTLLKLLENIYDKSARNRERRLLHVLVTSRSEEDIRSSLMKHLDDKHSVKLEKRLVAKDIRAFVHDQIRTDPGFEHWKKDEEAFEEIEETLTMKAGGM